MIAPDPTLPPVTQPDPGAGLGVDPELEEELALRVEALAQAAQAGELEPAAEEPAELRAQDVEEVFDWTAYHEIDEALRVLSELVLLRWRPRNARLHEPPVARVVQDALLDLRQVVREGRAIWLQLSEYAPREPQEPDEASGGRVGPNEQETQP